MEQIDTNIDDFKLEDPEIIEKDVYKLQPDLSCLRVRTQVSKMFLEGRN